MLKACLPLLAAALSLAAVASGADFSGIWTGHMADRNGDLQDFSFRFEQRDGVLSGKMYGDNESTPITDGRVSGDAITFLVTTELNGSITKTLFTGTFANGEIQVVRGRLDVKQLDSKPEKPAEPGKTNKPNPKQTFVLRRL